MVTASNCLSARHDAEAVLKPDPRSHVGRLLGWVLCWPWDLAWTLLVHNPIRELVRIFVAEIRSTLDEITRGELSQIETDFETETSNICTQSLITPAGPGTEQGAVPSVSYSTIEFNLASAPSTQIPPEDPWYAMRNQRINWFSNSDTAPSDRRNPPLPRLPLPVGTYRQ